jgi:hypothetical protein
VQRNPNAKEAGRSTLRPCGVEGVGAFGPKPSVAELALWCPNALGVGVSVCSPLGHPIAPKPDARKLLGMDRNPMVDWQIPPNPDIIDDHHLIPPAGRDLL